MPIYNKHDSKGHYYQWGNHGHKYYYHAGNNIQRLQAHERAKIQAAAAYANGYAHSAHK